MGFTNALFPLFIDNDGHEIPTSSILKTVDMNGKKVGLKHSSSRSCLTHRTMCRKIGDESAAQLHAQVKPLLRRPVVLNWRLAGYTCDHTHCCARGTCPVQVSGAGRWPCEA